MRSLQTLCHTLGLTAILLLSAQGQSSPETPLSFSRDIQPILSTKCFKCHGRDASSRKADLRLDQAAFALTRSEDGDPPVIVAGDPEASEFFDRIRTDDEDDLMPPPEYKKPLSEGEITLLKRWIEEGAKYEDHWAFSKPLRPQVPANLKQPSWARNPIDPFILAQLDRQQLEPNPPADRATLIRRVSFDLIGLPPTPEEVEAFVNDAAPLEEAYEKVLKRLFQSPHYGEHRARYWLDAARYGDTHGLHLDNYREMWPYRDWVIDAFNRNLPFDQFTIEQLAGDLLPEPTLDQRIATGFSRCNVTTSEGGAIDDEYFAIYAKDRVATMSKVWMGLSADCASCHDHKFDPLSMKDFYQLTAFFRNTTQRAMDGNAKDTPPNVFVPALQDRSRWFALKQEASSLRQALQERERDAMPDFSEWQANRGHLVPVDREHLVIQLPLNEGKGTRVSSTAEVGFPLVDQAQWIDGFVGKALQFTGDAYVELGDLGDFERDQAFSYGAWLKSPGKSTGAAIARMDRDDGHRGWDLWLQNDRVAAHLITTWPEDYVKVTTKSALTKDQWTHVFVTYNGSSDGSGIQIYFDGVPQPTEMEGKTLVDTILTTTSLKLGRRSTGQGFHNGAMHDFRLFKRALSSEEVTQLSKESVLQELLATDPAARTQEQGEKLRRLYLHQIDSEYGELQHRLTEIETEREALRKRGAVTLVMQEKETAPFAHMLRRGEYDQPGEKVFPATPAAMPPMPQGAPANRLGLARWLVDPEHPLTARVTINRLWQEIFGRGLVETAGDFGTMGQPPSHPQLLDWLAVEFRDSGWDVQHMIRLMVTSSTYRQSSDIRPEAAAQDPQNRLLARGPRFRLDGEMIRDLALATSGLLVPDVGGPSVKPYQPEGVWFAVGYTRSNTARFTPDTDEKLYRRSLYTFWKRTAPPPSMEIFNAPSREFCVVQRERTNTPLQALTLMNDPQFLEAARHLATHAIHHGGDSVRARLNYLTERILSRRFDAEEVTLITQSLNGFLQAYQQDEALAAKLVAIGESATDRSLAAPELAAWTMVASQILNFDEAITKH